MIKDEYIYKVKDVSIIDVVGDLTSDNIKNDGNGRKKCKCCFHDDHDPSMKLYENTNTYHCFVCGNGGDTIRFVMDYEHIGFEDAVLYLAKNYLHVDESEVKEDMTPEGIEKQREKETAYAYMSIAHDFFCQQLLLDNDDAKTCREYAFSDEGSGTGRIPSEFGCKYGFGFAPRSGHAFCDYARKKGLDFSILVSLGLIGKNEDGRYYDCFKNRLVIPHREKGRVINFTARDITGKVKPKYKNNRDSIIYKKSLTLFGIDEARSAAIQENRMYLVEGAFDVLRLQSLGINNVVAALGGEWSKVHFEALKKLGVSLCFVPDNDKPKEKENQSQRDQVFGAGFAFVMKHAVKALGLGFNVYVKEIPLEDEDVDSYITSKEIWDGLKEQEYIEWFTDKTYREDADQEDRLNQINNICDVIIQIPDLPRRMFVLQQLKDKYKQASLWNNSVKQAGMRMSETRKNEAIRKSGKDYFDCGFFVRDNYYYVLDSVGKEVPISNFKIESLYLIFGETASSRLLKLVNDEDETVIMELPQSHVTKLNDFKLSIERYGNYIFKGTDEQYTMVRAHMYKRVKKAYPVVQLGWNGNVSKGFYAFFDGVVYEGSWYAPDEHGIINLLNKNIYLPGMSSTHKDELKWSGRAKFVNNPSSIISRQEYFGKIIECFGDNGKVCICFYLATLFRDIIRDTTRSYPILNIFGKKGTGKTTLAMCITALFQQDGDLTTLGSTTYYALGEKLAEFSNAIVHLDEYKCSLATNRQDLLKGTYDDSGRDKKSATSEERYKTQTKCGIILTGQEMPTVDIALFERVIFLEAFRSVRTKEETDAMNELENMRKVTPTNITVDLLMRRKDFVDNWLSSWRYAQEVVKSKSDSNVSERIINNWSVMYAVCLTYEKMKVSLPFTSDELLRIIVSGIRNQNERSQTSDELANFWSLFDRARQVGDIIEKQHYKIARGKTSLILSDGRKTRTVRFDKPRNILFIRVGICISMANQQARREGCGDNVLTTESLLSYMTSSENEEYIGKNNANINFTVFDKQGNAMRRQVFDKKSGQTSWEIVGEKERPLAFDYDLICEHYDLDLERTYHVVSSDSTEIEEEKETEPGPEAVDQELPF